MKPMTGLELKAQQFAKRKHEGQKDDAELDYYISHILQVVHIIREVTDDVDIICAAHLHDTIEDTETNYEELVTEFNQRVADLVMEVTHDGEDDHYGRYFPRLKSKDGYILKFADRLSNLSRMDCWDIGRREHYMKKSKFWKDGSDKLSKNLK